MLVIYDIRVRVLCCAPKTRGYLAAARIAAPAQTRNQDVVNETILLSIENNQNLTLKMIVPVLNLNPLYASNEDDAQVNTGINVHVLISSRG